MGANRKVSLTALAAKQRDQTEPSEATTEPPALPEPAAEGHDTPRRTPARQRAATARKSRVSGSRPGEWVRYDELERKETRLRVDQYGRLSDASRDLNRRRSGQGERITENTLIRVAIDLLLAREQELSGTTEAEIRRSVGL